MRAHHTAITALITSSAACSLALAPGTTPTIAATGLVTMAAATTATDTTAGDITAMATTDMDIMADGGTDIGAAITMASEADMETASLVAMAMDITVAVDTGEATVAGVVMPVVDSIVAADSTVTEATAGGKRKNGVSASG